MRAAFGVGVISKLALATTHVDGLAIRPIDSPTAFREAVSPTLEVFVRAVGAVSRRRESSNRLKRR